MLAKFWKNIGNQDTKVGSKVAYEITVRFYPSVQKETGDSLIKFKCLEQIYPSSKEEHMIILKSKTFFSSRQDIPYLIPVHMISYP